MATHILTVTEKTFKVHLNYMFIGTGKDNSSHQFSALADILGVRSGDSIIFYVMNVGFFGVFKAVGNVFYEYDINNSQYLDEEIGGKTLTYRMKIEPIEVYKKSISEWDMMENPNNIKEKSVFNMQWSWIFKKLNASRGCLAIDKREFELFKNLLIKGNSMLVNVKNYDYVNKEIIELDNCLNYDNSKMNVSPRDNNIIFKIKKEEDLRILFTAQSGLSSTLDAVLDPIKNGSINFIANEVLCSFSERKMDLLFGTNKDKCLLIELKNEFIYNESIYNQIKEYARWVSSYKVQYKKIVPILVLKEASVLASRRGCKYFKYLSREDQNNNTKSDWYVTILKGLSDTKRALMNDSIENLESLQVYVFTTQNDNLEKFEQIV